MNTKIKRNAYNKAKIISGGRIMTREFLEENWAVSSYDEDTMCQIDYYIDEDNCDVGSKAYMYSHLDEELVEMEIVHIIALSNDFDLYNELLEDDDVLVNGEEEYGADCSAEFITDNDSYLVWFKNV
ncbi:MAG: hypothetical protein E7490_06125 [Ruminococcaceae bacterium]|nr:hypothetical protein [Oscillospiraceae bacterium]